MDVEKHLTHAHESKAKSRKKASEDMTKLQKLHGNVEKLAQEKSMLKMELNIKERECQLLCSMQEKDAYNQDLQKKIDKKRKKIKNLKQELQKKECELHSAMQEVQTQQEALLQSQEELKKQHEKVMQLQREKEKLDSFYNIEKEQVSKIVQILVSDKEEMQVNHLYSVYYNPIHFASHPKWKEQSRWLHNLHSLASLLFFYTLGLISITYSMTFIMEAR